MALDKTKFSLSTRFNILKIYDNDPRSISLAAIDPTFDPPIDYLLTVHGLGYIPRARVWYEPVTGELWPMSDKQYANADGGPGTPLSTLGSFYLTNTGLYVRIRFNGTAGFKNFRWRIYLDE